MHRKSWLHFCWSFLTGGCAIVRFYRTRDSYKIDTRRRFMEYSFIPKKNPNISTLLLMVSSLFMVAAVEYFHTIVALFPCNSLNISQTEILAFVVLLVIDGNKKWMVAWMNVEVVSGYVFLSRQLFCALWGCKQGSSQKAFDEIVDFQYHASVYLRARR